MDEGVGSEAHSVRLASPELIRFDAAITMFGVTAGASAAAASLFAPENDVLPAHIMPKKLIGFKASDKLSVPGAGSVAARARSRVA